MEPGNGRGSRQPSRGPRHRVLIVADAHCWQRGRCAQRWRGRPIGAPIEALVVDPIGGVHAVEFGANTKKVTNVPIRGTFRDYMIFPASARGIPLKIRVTVVVGTGRSVVNYAATPRA